MDKSPADLAYDELTAHYHGCAACTVTRDCAIGHGLLMAWGDLESREIVGGWWMPSVERASVRMAGEDGSWRIIPGDHKP